MVRLGTGGPAVGKSAQPHYEEEQVRLLPGDLVVVVSDAVLDARNVMGQPFGEERVAELVCEMRRHPLERVAEAILEGAQSYSGRREPTDDLCVIALRYAPGR